MWLAAAIIAFTEGGAEGGAIARPPGVSSARGTAAAAPAARAERGRGRGGDRQARSSRPCA